MRNKRILSVIALSLAIIFAIAPTFSTFAATKNVQYEATCPVIKVSGFMSNSLYKNIGSDNEEEIFPMESEAILALVKDCIPALTRFLIDKDWDKLGQTVTPIANACFADIMLDNNGEAKDNSGAKFIYPEPDVIKASKVISFKYDW